MILFLSACSNNNQSDSENTSNHDSNTEISAPEALTQEDLIDKDADELLIMRNEIFARHGYQFKNNFLAHYFAQFDWYKPQYDNVDEKLSETEKKNLELIIDAENKLKGKDVTFESLVSKFKDISNSSIYLNGEEVFIQASDMANGEIEISQHEFLDNIYLKKYFDINTDEMEEGCFFQRQSSIGMFYIPETNDLALICYETICPVPAVYLEYPIFVFDLDGNMHSKFRLAYDDGGAGDFTHTEAKVENGIITKYIEHKWDEWKEGANEPIFHNEEYTLKVVYDSKTHTFSEHRD